MTVDVRDSLSAGRVGDLREYLCSRYRSVRGFTEQLCQPLATEDYVVQSMPDVSPTKWHLAHISWFFETFLLGPHSRNYQSPDPIYNYLFNSYYNAIGERHARPKRGLLTRPSVAQTYDYRHYVDQHVLQLLETATQSQLETVAPIITLGLHHEQQHQELILTDIKHVLSCNPMYPAYLPAQPTTTAASVPAQSWVSYPEGVYWIGRDGDGFNLDFFFDNEGPRHRSFVEAFQIADRLVTNREYLAFIEDGGYKNPQLWLSDGWYTVQAENWQAPGYWQVSDDDGWQVFTLHGLQPLNLDEPVCHVSFFEADAYARWAGARLPSEAEWEIASADVAVQGNFVDDGLFHVAPLTDKREKLSQMYGDVWEWTASGYLPYPGFAPASGAIGEYNGKFMCNQFVLRGGSCATSLSHIRPTYRNFFPPSARWQFTGLRLAR